MTPEESLELHNAITALEQQDIYLGRVLKLMIVHLPGFALPEPAPAPVEEAPVVEPQSQEGP